MPMLDKIQIQLELSSSELRKLILRMPSLTGMAMSAFDDRFDFFVNEGKLQLLFISSQCSVLRLTISCSDFTILQLKSTCQSMTCEKLC